ncbi:hypothetical protein Aperf_G00000121914 [Anoplocephala perfoliata]
MEQGTDMSSNILEGERVDNTLTTEEKGVTTTKETTEKSSMTPEEQTATKTKLTSLPMESSQEPSEKFTNEMDNYEDVSKESALTTSSGMFTVIPQSSIEDFQTTTDIRETPSETSTEISQTSTEDFQTTADIRETTDSEEFHTMAPDLQYLTDASKKSSGMSTEMPQSRKEDFQVITTLPGNTERSSANTVTTAPVIVSEIPFFEETMNPKILPTIKSITAHSLTPLVWTAASTTLPTAANLTPQKGSEPACGDIAQLFLQMPLLGITICVVFLFMLLIIGWIGSIVLLNSRHKKKIQKLAAENREVTEILRGQKKQSSMYAGVWDDDFYRATPLPTSNRNERSPVEMEEHSMVSMTTFTDLLGETSHYQKKIRRVKEDNDDDGGTIIPGAPSSKYVCASGPNFYSPTSLSSASGNGQYQAGMREHPPSPMTTFKNPFGEKPK